MSSALQAAEVAWEKALERDGIQVFTRPVPGSSIAAVKGVAVIKASLSRLTQLLREPEYRSRWDELCGEAYVFKRLSEQEELVYIQNNLPWPIKDRDLLASVHWSQDPVTLTVTMTSLATDGIQPPVAGRVRITNATNEWRLKPLADGHVEVTTIIHLDPAGPLPGWLINRLSLESPFDALSRLGRLVNAGDIPQKRYAFIRSSEEQ